VTRKHGKRESEDTVFKQQSKNYYKENEFYY